MAKVSQGLGKFLVGIFFTSASLLFLLSQSATAVQESELLPTTVSVRVSASSDDAEENTKGNISAGSTDLELVYDGGDQTVGIRFQGLTIPPGATIQQASIQFQVDEIGSTSTDLLIAGQASDDAGTFNDSISSRPATVSKVSWQPEPWLIIGEAGSKQKTPDLSAVIQEIVDRPGWQYGNALALIITGTGERVAESFDGMPEAAPLLQVTFSGGQTPTHTPTASPLPPGINYRFAVIGDYGSDSSDEARVAALVASWEPDFVITTGDNNYPDGESVTIDENIGKHYSSFIGNYQGIYGGGSQTNRFWPSLGNHDWHTITCSANNCSGAYFDYFTLPGNERYYTVDYGLVRLLVLDSDSQEPDGDQVGSVQAAWLQQELAASASCYNVVYFHHAPYSSGNHGSDSDMQWPFDDWGADVVMSGHDHSYERLSVNGLTYIVNGSGGSSIRDFPNLNQLEPEATSMVRYNGDHGALLVTATEFGISYQFFNAAGVLVDELTEPKSCQTGETATPSPTNTPPQPTETNTPEPPTPTFTPSNTPMPSTATNTPESPTPSDTPESPSPTPTNTPVPPTPTATDTPEPPTPTNTPVPPTPTDTPVPPTATNTPEAPTATSTPVSENLALNQPVSESSFQDLDYIGSFAVDGDLATQWQTTKVKGKGSSDPEWIIVDLGMVRPINRMILKWDNFFATSYSILISEDNSNWTTLFSTALGDGGDDDIIFQTTTARYVKLNSTAWSSSTWRIRLVEFEIYSDGGVPPDTPTPSPTATFQSGASIHVSDLEAASFSSAGGNWQTQVFVTIHNQIDNVISNAEITFEWTAGGSIGSVSCMTDGAGQCGVISDPIPNREKSTTFTVSSVTHPELPYVAADNHDADGDSNGNSITMERP